MQLFDLHIPKLGGFAQPKALGWLGPTSGQLLPGIALRALGSWDLSRFFGPPGDRYRLDAKLLNTQSKL